MRWLPESVSSFGGALDSLIVLITVFTGLGLVAAEAVLLYAALRFRHSRSPRAAYVPGTGWGQTRWVLVPALLLLGADLYIDHATHATWQAIKGSVPQADQVVRITGQQYGFHFTYPGPDGRWNTADDFQQTGELHVPVGETVVFDLEARDVLHSFWVPALRLKQDAIPGRTIQGWFRATKPGEYEVACAEICGPGHTGMRAKLVVHPVDDYKQWVASRGTAALPTPDSGLSPEEREGWRLVQQRGCLACHNVDGSTTIGPSYRGLFGRRETVVAGGREREVVVDEAYLRRAILDPAAEVVKGYQPLMPSQQGLLTEAELAAIIAYLKTLQSARNPTP
jgi:cytochrome c oxidase subunit 2